MTDANFVLRPSSQPLRLVKHVIDDAQNPVDEWKDDGVAPTTAAPGSSRRSVWALADQGAVSLGNCLTNVLIARSMAVAQFGIFAILVEAILFLNSLQAALVIYPLSVRGAVLDRDGLRKLAGTCLLLTAIMALPLGLALATAGGVVGSVVTGSLAAIALASWQAQETLRRAMMAHGGQRRALPGDLISYVGQALIVLVLSMTGMLSINLAFAVMAITSLGALAVQSFQIGPVIPRSWRDLCHVSMDFWRLGRWVLVGNLTMIVTTLGCSWTLVWFHGPDAVGRFQVLANLMKLSNPLTICMAGLIVPAAARAFRMHGIAAAKSVTRKYSALTVAVLTPYFLFLLILPTTAIHLLYGAGSAYGSMSNQLRAFVIWYAALLVSQIGGCLLNAIEQSRRSFVAQALQTVAVIFIALPLTAMYGVDGLMLGGVIGNLVMAACYISMIRKLEESPDALHMRRVEDEMQASVRKKAA